MNEKSKKIIGASSVVALILTAFTVAVQISRDEVNVDAGPD